MTNTFLTRVSTHSRPKAAGIAGIPVNSMSVVSTHSRPKAAGIFVNFGDERHIMFQHTAARRRLDVRYHPFQGRDTVSTHSRPKAAGLVLQHRRPNERVSTHSRPKAAGRRDLMTLAECISFNTQPPEGGWGISWVVLIPTT